MATAVEQQRQLAANAAEQRIAPALVQPVQRQAVQRHCRVCGRAGHNRRTCPQNRQQQLAARQNQLERRIAQQQQQVARQRQVLLSQQQQVARRQRRQQQQVARQPVVETIIEPTTAEPIETEDCPICMEKLGKTNCCTTGCGHQYCLNCFVKHVGTKDTCPVCRQKVPSNKKSSSSSYRNSWFAFPIEPSISPLPTQNRNRNSNAFNVTIENTFDQTIHLDWLPNNREPVRLQTNITPLSSRTQRVGNRGDRFSIVIDGNPNTHTFTANNAGETFIFTGDSVISYD